VAQEPAEMVKVPSEICVEKVECLHPSESGEDGTEELTLSKRDTPLLLHLLHQLFYLLCKPEDTELIMSQNYH